MSNCSSGFPWNFDLASDDGKHVTFGVDITDAGGNQIKGRVRPNGPDISEGFCRTKGSQTVMSFKVNMSRVVGGTTEIRKFVVVGVVTDASAKSKGLFGSYYAASLAPGELALAADPGDTGTAGGTTGV